MQQLPQAATILVAVLGVTSLIVARIPAFRKDFRRSVSIAVGAVSFLTILLSLNVLLAGMTLHESAAVDELAMVNGLLLAGFVLMLVSTLAFFFALGVLIWTLVPIDPKTLRLSLPDPTAPPQPIDPYTR